MVRRIKAYKDINNEEKGNSVLLDFFRENKVEIKQMGIEGETIYEMKAFIERVFKFKLEWKIQKLYDF